MNTTIADASRTFTWRDIEPANLKQVRMMLRVKYSSLTDAAAAMKIPFIRLSMALGGRESVIWIIATIQNDLDLSNEQVLALWPLLREWPKADRRAA